MYIIQIYTKQWMCVDKIKLIPKSVDSEFKTKLISKSNMMDKCEFDGMNFKQS